MSLGFLSSVRLVAAAVAVTIAVAMGRQDVRKRPVFIKTVKQSDDNRKRATVENTVAGQAVLIAAENQKCYENPKGGVTLNTTMHKKPPVFCRRVCKVKNSCGLFFLLHTIL